MVINFAEGQVITPHLLGHRMTLNPFLMFLSTAFGIWIWGPIGGAIAVPMLLVSQVVLVHVLPHSDRTLWVVEKKLAAAVYGGFHKGWVGLDELGFCGPAVAGELLVFLASLYFYLATRHVSRRAVLSVVTNRALRWRLAHVYREIEHKISSFLVTVTMLNLAVGVAVAASMQLVGLPSPGLVGGASVCVELHSLHRARHNDAPADSGARDPVAPWIFS
jgi:predicted PurR-regulated permease PerM